MHSDSIWDTLQSSAPFNSGIAGRTVYPEMKLLSKYCMFRLFLDVILADLRVSMKIRVHFRPYLCDPLCIHSPSSAACCRGRHVLVSWPISLI
jgi:hypothetical protein